MATAPQPTLPLFYNDLMPLNSRDHATWKTKSLDSAEWLSKHHAIPRTADEFVQAQRDFPIVFSSGDNPLPLALMGLNEGVPQVGDRAKQDTSLAEHVCFVGSCEAHLLMHTHVHACVYSHTYNYV